MKRLLSVMLAAVLVFGVVACNGDTDDTQTPDGTRTTTGDDNNGDDSEATVDNGEVPTIYAEGFAPMRNNEARQPSTDEAFAEMQQKIIDDIGVKVEPVFMPAGVETERLNLRIASQSEPFDMIMTGNWMEYLKNDQIVPVTQYLDDMTNLHELYPMENEGIWGALTDADGEVYGFPRGVPTTSYPVWIREDWLALYDLEQPTTVDELETVLQTFKDNDPAGNGQTIPLVADTAGLYMGFSAGFTEQGYGFWLDETTNTVKHPVQQEGFRDAVAKMADWYQKGLIHTDSFSTSNEDHRTWLEANRVAATLKWYSLVAINEPTLQSAVPDALYGYSPVIEGPTGTIQTSSKPSTGAIMILKKSDHPEAVAKFVEWLCDVENFISSYIGIRDKDWHYSNEEESFVVRDDELRYGGEFYLYPNNMGIASYTIMPDDDTQEANNYNHYLTVGSYRYDDVKVGGDYNVLNIVETLDEIAPNRGDVDTMISVEMVSFLTGNRSLDEWDDFIENDLSRAGLENLLEAQTQLFRDQGFID